VHPLEKGKSDMKRIFLRSSLLLAFLVIFNLMLGQDSALAELGISSVQPGMVSNMASAQLTISGSDFVDGAEVSLDGIGQLNTTFVNSNTLRATLPAGLTPGTYTITVTNPGGNYYSLYDAITVADVAPTSQLAPTTQPAAATERPAVVSSERPLLVIDSYNADVDRITPGTDFTLVIKLRNVGKLAAKNVVASFAAGDFIVRRTGGVLAVNEMDAGEKHRFEQPLSAGYDLWGKTIGSVSMTVEYSDENGSPYSSTFALNLPVKAAYGSGATATPTPTPTPVPISRPQLVISSYGSDALLLQPGTQFHLQLQAQNVGNADAHRITMILGGGSSDNASPSGTQQPAGVSGSGGDFGNFAPVASSNVQFVGDLNSGASLSAKAALIVNASTEPGAYPIKISFSYSDDKNNTYNDDQVITLLVYSPPQVEINFYRDPGPLYAGQLNQLPLQIVNLGRKPTVLGNMKVASETGQLNNNTTLVGALDAGGYFTLDATFIPDMPGPQALQVNIEYTDDFNQPQVITRTIQVEIQESSGIGPGGEGGLPQDGSSLPPEPVQQSETLLQKVTRFLRGLVGLDSGQPTPQPNMTPPGEVPPGEGAPGPVMVPPPKG
jgi:hypothetical protein